MSAQFKVPKMFSKYGTQNKPACVHFCTSSHLLDFASKRNTDKLLGCVLHYMEDVRQKAGHLLSHCRIDDPLWSTMLRNGLELVCSPKTEENGAVLIQLCLKLRPQAFVREMLSVQTSNPTLAASVKAVPPAVTSPCQALLCLYQVLLDRVRQSPKDILTIAKEAPMHGILLTVRKCIRLDTSLQACFFGTLCY